jgi:hypothetical protein
MAVLAVTVRVFLWFNDAFLHMEVGFDEAFFVWTGWSILKGLVPYRDFLEYKPPLLFLTHALALKLYGLDAEQFRYLFLYLPLGSLIALALAMISRGINKVSTLALLLALIHIWVNPSFHDTALSDSESIGLTYYFFGVAFLIARTPFRGWTDTIGAAFLACSALSKEPFAVCALATWACCFFMGPRTSSLRGDAVRYVKFTMLGVIVVVGALCIYMVPTGAMSAYIEVARTTASAVRGGANGGYCVSQGRFHPTTPLNDFFEQWRLEREEYVNLATLGYLIPFALASVVFIGAQSPMLLGFAVLVCLVGLWTPMTSFCHWIHHYNMTLSGIFFFFIVGLDAMESAVYGKAGRTFVCLTLLAIVLVKMEPRLESESKLYGTRTFPPLREPVPGVLKAVADHTTTADRIFTNGTPLLYVQTNRRSAVRESGFLDPNLSFYEGETDEDKLRDIRAQLERHMPQVFVLDPDLLRLKPRTNRVLMLPFLADHHYQKLSEYIWLRPD